MDGGERHALLTIAGDSPNRGFAKICPHRCLTQVYDCILHDWLNSMSTCHDLTTCSCAGGDGYKTTICSCAGGDGYKTTICSCAGGDGYKTTTCSCAGGDGYKTTICSCAGGDGYKTT